MYQGYVCEIEVMQLVDIVGYFVEFMVLCVELILMLEIWIYCVGCFIFEKGEWFQVEDDFVVVFVLDCYWFVCCEQVVLCQFEVGVVGVVEFWFEGFVGFGGVFCCGFWLQGIVG